MKALKHKNGMTLLELLTVIGIIAVLAAVSLPSFVYMARGSRMRTAAKMLTDTISAARGLAIAQRHAYYVEYDNETVVNPEHNRIRIFYMPLENSAVDPIKRWDVTDYARRMTFGDWKMLPEPIVFFDATVIINPNLKYDMPDPYIRFDANGGIHGANPREFTIVNSTTLEMDGSYNAAEMEKAKTCNININNVTGRVKAVIE